VQRRPRRRHAWWDHNQRVSHEIRSNVCLLPPVFRERLLPADYQDHENLDRPPVTLTWDTPAGNVASAERSRSSRSGLAGALAIGAAAALLAACGGSQPPIGAPDATPQSQKMTLPEASTSSKVYVADNAHAVIEFDASGRELAKATMKAIPLDVVVDSHGHVYVLGAAGSSWRVWELTSDLQHRIATYETPNIALTMTIDANNNLYVSDSDYQSGYEHVIEYSYGSTKIAKTFLVGWAPGGPPTLAGISVSGNNLFTILYPGGRPDDFLKQCRLAGSSCKSIAGLLDDSCGFTMTTGSIGEKAFGTGVALLKIIPGRGYKDIGVIKLPAGYYIGWAAYGLCNLHGRGKFFWTTMANSTTGDAVAVEFNATTGKMVKTIGSGYLERPVAAYQTP